MIDEKTAGELHRHLALEPGTHRVRVTSLGLPLSAAIRVDFPAGASVELALKVCLAGLLIGMVIFIAVLSALAPLAAMLAPRVPRYEPLVVLAVLATVIATCLLDFYALLPAFFHLHVPAGPNW